MLTATAPSASRPPNPASGDRGAGQNRPRFLDDEAFRCLRAGDLAGFHQAIADRSNVDLSGSDLRSADLRRADLSKVVLRGAYLKDADLRGLDLRHLDLEGCSLHNAKIGGVFFPDNLPAAEILLSVQLGTRLRPQPAGVVMPG